MNSSLSERPIQLQQPSTPALTFATMAPSEVQQWQTRQNGIDKLTRGAAPMPSPGDGEVLVEVKAVSLNYRDTEGEYPTAAHLKIPDH